MNQTEGVDIATRYEAGHVLVEGNLGQAIAARTITQALEAIPGVRSVTNTVNLQPLQIPIRIFFNPASATIPPADRGYKLKQVLWFLQHDSNQQLRIIGHSDPLAGDLSAGVGGNQALALRRDSAVRAALVNQGADPRRLQLWGTVERSPGASSKQPAWQHRYVEFEPIAVVVKPH